MGGVAGQRCGDLCVWSAGLRPGSKINHFETCRVGDRRSDRHHFRFSDGQRSSLVENHGGDFPGFFQRHTVPDQDAAAAAALALAMMAAGVARPIAHGHATIKTAAAMMNPAAAPVGDMTCQRNGASRS